MKIPNRQTFHSWYEQGEESLYQRFCDVSQSVNVLEKEVKRLQNIQSKDSHNSSKPPSSDIKKPKRTKSLRKSSGKKSGGQPGHKGHTLKAVSNPDHIDLCKLHECPHCQASLDRVSALTYESRQVFDIPPLQIEVTEHRAEIKECPQCKQFSRANFPSGVSLPVQYGEHLKAQLTYFNNYHFIPLERTVEIIEDLFHHKISQGSFVTANSKLTDCLQPFEEASIQQLIESDVNHFDESGLKVAGTRQWLHVCSTPLLTYYHVDPKRGSEAMDNAGILPFFNGTAVHDHWKSYFSYEICSHSLCNAHHLRELIFIRERYEQGWAKDMSNLLLEIKNDISRLPDEQIAFSTSQLNSFEQRYDSILISGFQVNPPPLPPQKK